MLASMTGFAKTDFSSPLGVFHWEIRCVNNRYLEARFYLPDQLSIVEPSFRDLLREQLSRGRCDINCRFLPQVTAGPLQINQAYVEALLQQLNHLSQSANVSLQYNAFDLLRWPGVQKLSENADTALQDYALASFKAVIQQLVIDRQREGHQIQQLLSHRLQTIHTHLQHICERVPELLPLMRERLLNSLQQLQGELNQERLEQELVYLAQKMDVEEEIDRFTTHLHEFKSVLEKGGAVGRRLDFLLQELQREINTLGSKANDKIVSQQVVDVKVLIEQIREQVQNVE
jgi:uncharacterized protein (TIGR00255 family)